MALIRTRIELDCGEMPPGCGFECGACIQEIKDTLEVLDGVSNFAQHLDGSIEIEHDPERVSPERILEVVSGLPTRLDGSFRPTLASE